VGTDAIPPRAGGLPARLVLGPALRAQSDRRLVRLVREGYEGAFEEIVRRYRRPLGRFAASIVGGHHEDVTQDSFRKALEAMRGGDAEIELRPWLYRIVRNTALNDLRDRPPAAAELAEGLVAGTRSAAAEAEAREEVTELIERLRALPEKQRAALLMRELDGMGHDEIAATLGISKGAARQAIARGRAAVRSGFGALLPMPLLRSLLEGAVPTEAGVGAGTGAAAGAAATAIGAGGAGALKIGLATVVVAGSLGAGVAIEHGGAGHVAEPPSGVATHKAASDGRRSAGSPAAAEDRAAPSREDVDELATDHRSSGRHGDGDHDRHGDENRGPGRGHREDDHDESAVGIAGSPVGADDEDAGRSTEGPGRDRGGRSFSGHGQGSDDDHSGSSDGHGSGSGSSGAAPPAEASPSGGTGSSSSSSGGPGPSSGSSGSSESDDPPATATSGSPGGPSTAPTESPAEPAEVLDDSSSHGGGGGDSSGGPDESGDS
jgi:RNA polymerase sigma factor (sigma-70 family)